MKFENKKEITNEDLNVFFPRRTVKEQNYEIWRC